MEKMIFEEIIRKRLNCELDAITVAEGMEEKIFGRKTLQRRNVTKYAAVAAFALLFCTMVATAAPAVTYWFQGVINYSARNTYLLETIGRVVDQSDTDNGIKISLKAIAGDENIIFLVFEMEREDGEAFDQTILSSIQEESAYFSCSYLETYSPGGDAGIGNSWIDPEKSTEHLIRFYVKEMMRNSLPGRFMTVHFENFSKANDQEEGILAEGNWSITFRASYPNQSVKLVENTKKTIQGYDVVVKKIAVSPIGVSVQLSCRDEKIFEDMEDAKDVFLPEITVVLKDGSILSGELSELSSGSASWVEGKEIFQHHVLRNHYFYCFDELTTLNEIDYVKLYGEYYRLEKTDI